MMTGAAESGENGETDIVQDHRPVTRILHASWFGVPNHRAGETQLARLTGKRAHVAPEHHLIRQHTQLRQRNRGAIESHYQSFFAGEVAGIEQDALGVGRHRPGLRDESINGRPDGHPGPIMASLDQRAITAGMNPGGTGE